MAYTSAAFALLSLGVCLSVWLGVTFVYCVKTAKDTAIVATKFNANRKPYPSFRMVPFPMTLSGP